MMKTLIIILILLMQVLLPAAFILWIWKRTCKCKLDWLLPLLTAGTFILYMFLAGRWDWLSYYLRFILVATFLWVAYKSYRRTKDLQFFSIKDFGGWLSFGLNAVALMIFSLINISTVMGFFYEGKPIKLSFPLKDGIYYVGHGGASRTINAHHANRSQKYALDISKLTVLGTRCWGIFSDDLSKYEIFGDTLYSPCDGLVEETENRLNDLKPGERDSVSIAENRMNLAGNRVVIKSIGVKIVLAHIMQGSVLVRKGDSVNTGQPLGRVGNSGNTSEPHLHIHAVKNGDSVSVLKGEGVPLVFKGRFLVRNSLVIE